MKQVLFDMVIKSYF